MEACNIGKKHLLGSLFGDDRKKWTHEIFNSPRMNREPGYLAAAGAYQDCVSADGVFDMVGNLHEWVSDELGRALLRKLEAEEVRRHDQPYRLGNGVFLGGFYSTLGEHGPGCFFVTYAHEQRYHDYSTGFRCCADAREETP
jgi:formylglycine-generating enzyme required for sulfatase activity